MYTKILVAYDESPGGRAALDRAEALAKPLGAALTLIRAVGEGRLSVGAKPDTIAAARTALQREIARYRPDLDAELWVVGMPASGSILAAASEMEADLIVTGSRHRGTVRRTFLGSVSSDLIHQAPCDVLVVHPIED